MRLTDERRLELQVYCKIDDPTDDDKRLLDMYYSAATGYIGISTPTPGTERAAQYDLIVNALVLDMWEHRNMTEPYAYPENITMRRILNQLKLTEGLVSNSDTSPGEDTDGQ